MKIILSLVIYSIFNIFALLLTTHIDLDSDSSCIASNSGIGKAGANGLIDIFQDSSFRAMFIYPLKFKKHLKTVALLCLKGIHSARKALDSFQARDPNSFVAVAGFQAATQSLDRVEKVARFMGSLLFRPDQFDSISETTSATPLNPADDSVAIVGYTGKEALEKGLKELVAKTVEWSTTVNEVVKTSASSLKLRPQKERAMETLLKIKADPTLWSPERLEELCALFPEMLSGMRAIETEDVTNLMIEQVHLLADSLLADQLDVVKGSRLAQTLLRAFQVFSARAGSTEKAREVTKWMQAHEGDLVLSDLMQVADKVTSEGVSDLVEVQALMVRLSKVVVPSDRRDLTEATRKMPNTSFRALIAEARGLCSSPYVQG